MLRRFEEIQGIGLFHDAKGSRFGCGKATLVYADNGRGKSTLAAILRSLSTGSAAAIKGMGTIDGRLPPRAVLQFDDGQRVTYQDGEWSERRRELVVFDAEFVSRNVHSGGTVNTDHRKNLLEFAMGEAAVTARENQDAATAQALKAKEEIKRLSEKLSGYHPGLTLDRFERLSPTPDVDRTIADVQAKIVAADGLPRLEALPVPAQVAEPSLDIDGLFSVLATSLDDIHADAGQVVSQHISRLGRAGAEDWLSQGRAFGDGDRCPYCDQDVSGNELVHSYRPHFNAAYTGRKRRVSEVQAAVSDATAPHVVEALARDFEVASSRAAAWSGYVRVEAVLFDSDGAHQALAEIREFVLDLLQRKAAAPADPVGDVQAKDRARDMLGRLLALVRDANSSVRAAAGIIADFKGQSVSNDSSQLREEIKRLQLAKSRYEAGVVDLFRQLNDAHKESRAAEAAKNSAREELNRVMEATLRRYRDSVNKLLMGFGATFSIASFKANYMGGSPRSEYGIELRGKSVRVEGGVPSFATALSEGDKRTLAFAFFVASTLQDSGLAERFVVVDDPMSSFDTNRKSHTRAVLGELYSKAGQVIVLAHDAYFLRDLRDAFHKRDGGTPIAQLRLVGTEGGYTAFDALDIDKECESSYARHHRRLAGFVDGSERDLEVVAKAIRPMLEGHLHRRFPGLIPKEVTLGQCVASIRASEASSPLCHARNLVDELHEINEYASQFHHDTDSGSGRANPTETELRTFVRRALCVVHSGAPLDAGGIRAASS